MHSRRNTSADKAVRGRNGYFCNKPYHCSIFLRYSQLSLCGGDFFCCRVLRYPNRLGNNRNYNANHNQSLHMHSLLYKLLRKSRIQCCSYARVCVCNDNDRTYRFGMVSLQQKRQLFHENKTRLYVFRQKDTWSGYLYTCGDMVCDVFPCYRAEH